MRASGHGRGILTFTSALITLFFQLTPTSSADDSLNIILPPGDQRPFELRGGDGDTVDIDVMLNTRGPVEVYVMRGSGSPPESPGDVMLKTTLSWNGDSFQFAYAIPDGEDPYFLYLINEADVNTTVWLSMDTQPVGEAEGAGEIQPFILIQLILIVVVVLVATVAAVAARTMAMRRASRNGYRSGTTAAGGPGRTRRAGGMERKLELKCPKCHAVNLIPARTSIGEKKCDVCGHDIKVGRWW